MFTKRF